MDGRVGGGWILSRLEPRRPSASGTPPASRLADGNLRFAERSASNIGRITARVVRKHDRHREQRDHHRVPIPTSSSGPTSLTAGPEEATLWFAEQEGNNIARITP